MDKVFNCTFWDLLAVNVHSCGVPVVRNVKGSAGVNDVDFTFVVGMGETNSKVKGVVVTCW
jgi:hypothetical protein